MHPQDLEIRPFPLRSASDEEYARLNAFKNVLRLEELPEDPPAPLRDDVNRWHALPQFQKEECWAAWDVGGQKIAAFGQSSIYLTGDNEHQIDFNIEVLPEFRRRGWGRRLLRLIAQRARSLNRRLMSTETNDRVPAGAEFLTRLGGRRGLEARLNELQLAKLDRDLINRWLEQAKPLVADFSIGAWDNRYPEAVIQEVADMFQVVANDQPRDTLDMEDENWTPERIRQSENLHLAGGDERWTLYAMDRKTNRVAGMTDVFWNPSRPAVLWQGFTAVMPAYRSKGLGRWLKAEMMTRILRERPGLRVIRTGNANSNAPMIKINVELGFKPYIAFTVWQVPTESVEQYLSAAAAAAA